MKNVDVLIEPMYDVMVNMYVPGGNVDMLKQLKVYCPVRELKVAVQVFPSMLIENWHMFTVPVYGPYM